MKRKTLGIALASSAVVVVLLTLVFRVDLQPTSEPRPDKTRQAQDPSIDTEPRGSAVTTNRSQAPDDPQVNAVEEAASHEWGYIDEETLKEHRDLTRQDVEFVYSHPIELLELTSEKEEALLKLLVEDKFASTSIGSKTGLVRGEHIDTADQSKRIAAIIGESKLQQFREMEQNIRSFVDLANISSTLEQRNLPVTRAQRDRMLEILIEIQNQEIALPGAGAEKGTIEDLGYRMAEMDERERLVLEQAASVLSAEQLRYVFERYQRLSYARSDSLENRRKKSK